MKIARVVFVFVVLALAGGGVPAGAPACASRYFVLLFGGSGDTLRPTTAHVWATYVKTTPQPDGTVRVEPLTISWLPVQGKVRPLAGRPEPGRNYSLEETMALMTCGPRARVAVWGPYEIRACRYEQAVAQKAWLDSGAVLYKVNDWFDRRPDVDHCLHAVTRAHPDLHARCRVVRWYGEAGTAPVAAQMVKVGVIADPTVTHDWLLPALGLDKFPLVRRAAGDGVLFK